MEKNQETITDIIAEKRRRADKIERNCAARMESCKAMSDLFTRRLVADIRSEADRLEAARKREVDKLNSAIQATVGRSDAEIDRLRREIAELKRAGNAAKLREALVEIRKLFVHTSDERDFYNITRSTIDAALAAPPRNCDIHVGSNSACREWRKYLARHAILAQGWRTIDAFDWLLAPATEKEGGAK